MSRLRRALTFENVLVTVVAFVVLAGGTAFAASQLGKNSVGKKQLKAKSVGTAELKKNAVTGAKIKNGAVTGAKVKDGAVGLAALSSTSNPFAGIVHSTGSGSGTLETAMLFQPATVPLTAATFTQAAGESVLAVGKVRLTFAEGCAGGAKRIVFAGIYPDSPDPLQLDSTPGLAKGIVYDLEGGGADTVNLGLTSFGGGIIPAPPAPTNHVLYLHFYGFCENPGKITLSDADIDLIGVR